ncbi:hypothetical protein BDA99DRAFT_538945 [Phascolomyces articulosus]|uniref:Uncharacterized protein n=1 Tax=Phascolomyces articulosus TaxID=60185 RepID=A0AAD5PCK5_9FUNG|nr:hypothetical protein BDA99DRAFT_538945 [Phascolomyces articulosus]
MARTLIFLMMTFVTILPYYSVLAYCFYNKMSDATEVSIVQVEGQLKTTLISSISFEHFNMPPGSKECCPYTDNECSREKKQDSTCKFLLSYRKGPNKPDTKKQAGRAVIGSCGGYITATGTYDSFSYQVYDENNKQIASGP